MTAWVWKNRILDVFPGHEARPMLGIAVDIGTTTLAGYLLNLHTGERLGSASCLNPQKAYGDDVITRCDFCRAGQEQLTELQRLVAESVSALAAQMCGSAGVPTEQVVAVALAGNTVMMHIAAGISPEHIAQAPFVPVMTSTLELPAAALGVAGLHPEAWAWLMPCVSGYVGADTIAAVMACEMDQAEELSLLVDIGTNGEIVLGNRRRLMACSTAAGPAFEGAHILHGMGGVTGAISRVWLEGDTLKWDTIGSAPAAGLCGSGLIDVIALALEQEIISPLGLLQEGGSPVLNRRLIRQERGLAWRVTEGEAPILLCQRDIREVQLAKGAIAAGIETMAAAMGVALSEISRVYLSGGMGNYMDAANACAIGLLPGELAGRIRPIGNGAGTGAQRFLLAEEERARAKALPQRIEYLELSARSDFQGLFIDKMLF